MGYTAKHVKIVSCYLDIDRSPCRGALFLCRDADFGTRYILYPVSDIFYGYAGRIGPLFQVIELDTYMIGRVVLKCGLSTGDSYCPRIDMFYIGHVSDPSNLLTVPERMNVALHAVLIAIGWIRIGRWKTVALPAAERDLYLPGDPVRIFQVSTLGHVQVDINAVGFYGGKELNGLFKPYPIDP